MTGRLHRMVRTTRRRLVFFICAAAVVLTLLGGGGYFAVHRLNQPEPVVLAFAGSLTGPLSLIGQEALATTQLFVDDVNYNDGIEGRPLRLLIFDDRSQPDIARANVAAILASPALGVVGHSSGRTSIAAGAGYRAGGIAAVTSHASTDELTRDNPCYFSTLSPASEEAAAAALADRLADEPEPKVIILGTETDTTAPLLKAIRRRGVRSRIILSSGAASDSFAAQFGQENEVKEDPDFFVGNVFAMAPVIMDNVGAYGQGLALRYRDRTGKQADWYAVGAQDAIRTLVAAVRDSSIAEERGTIQEARAKVHAALAAINEPSSAVTGVGGMLYFDDRRNVTRPMRYGHFYGNRLVSAPLQVKPLLNRELIDLPQDIKAGNIVLLGSELYWLQRIVTTGIDLTKPAAIDVKAGTFSADFYFWMRYADVIRMRNLDYPSARIAYVIDQVGMQLDRDNGPVDQREAFRDLQTWHARTLRRFTARFYIRSTLGNPSLAETQRRTEYGAMSVAIIV